MFTTGNIRLDLVQAPGNNDWAAKEDFINSNYCCTQQNFDDSNHAFPMTNFLLV